jgi:hypothetical protein
VKQVPVILCDEWTPAQVKAFRLMVNRSVTWAEWDEDLLSLEVLERLLGERKPLLNVTDPPYGIELDSRGRIAKTIASDNGS